MTDIIRPRCGRFEAHDAHDYERMLQPVRCYGLMAAEAAAIRMFDASLELAHVLSPYTDLTFRIECHPAVVSALMRIVLLPFSDLGPPRLLYPLYTISDMPLNSWRIVAASDGTTGDRLAAAREKEIADERR
jgi:hypothetical protein